MSSSLSASQCAALFDILTHYDTYLEIQEFRYPGSLKHYGPPFTAEPHRVSTSPLLQSLVSRFLLTLPGLKDLPAEWWEIQAHDIIENLERSNLSESYDKGAIGIRKTLATAISALIEYPVRGTYGGFAPVKDGNRSYDCTNAADLSRAFRDFMDECIYGDVLDSLVKKAAETDDLADHEPLTKAVHEFVLVNLASLMHYTLILSPKGQYLLKLIDGVNKLVPYIVIRQTLRIGNVATMISGMVKIGLAKMSVATLTNWMGFTQTQSEGMNLMQHIISQVLLWDVKELEARASKLEREREKLGKSQLQALKDYSVQPREKQEQARSESQENSISIVAVILRDANLEYRLTDMHHNHALEYLNIQLSIRDRKEIIKVLCHSVPDHLTQSVRELVTAYEPVIRQAHNAIDLSGTVGDFEYFLKDLIKLAKIQTDKSGKSCIPTVGDFIQLLRKHQHACHNFIHQCCKNGPELTSWYLEWAQTAASAFKVHENSNANKSDGAQSGAGDLSTDLNDLFKSLAEEKRSQILPILDEQCAYIDDMHTSSAQRLKSVLKSPASKNPAIAKIFSTSASRPSSRASSPVPWFRGSNNTNSTTTANSSTDDPGAGNESNQPPPTVTSDPGPGAFLARWQDLLDKTPITPLTQSGPLAKATDAAVVAKSARDVDGETMVEFKAPTDDGNDRANKQAKGGNKNTNKSESQTTKTQEPDVSVVIDAMGEKFRALLAEKSCYW